MELQEVAAKLGVHRGTLFHWLSGHRSPSKESMLRIEEELGWPVEEQMKAYNTLTGGTNSRGRLRDDFGASFRAFLEKEHGVPPADPGRVGQRS